VVVLADRKAKAFYHFEFIRIWYRAALLIARALKLFIAISARKSSFYTDYIPPDAKKPADADFLHYS
jgi:hypothetical protein